MQRRVTDYTTQTGPVLSITFRLVILIRTCFRLSAHQVFTKKRNSLVKVGQTSLYGWKYALPNQTFPSFIPCNLMMEDSNLCLDLDHLHIQHNPGQQEQCMLSSNVSLSVPDFAMQTIALDLIQNRPLCDRIQSSHVQCWSGRMQCSETVLCRKTARVKCKLSRSGGQCCHALPV